MREITEIKTLRQKLHLTQKQLAEQSGVSQSLIAKIEASRLDPSYSNAQKIFEALHLLEESTELKAKDIMHRGVIFCKASDPVKDVITVMKRRGISQVPVLEREKIIGIITENAILNYVAERPAALHKALVEEVMENVPPIIAPNTGIKTIIGLLKDYPMILIAEKGDIKGIISKSDVLGRM